MNARVRLPLLAALACGLAASALAYAWMQSMAESLRQAQAPTANDEVSLIVAAETIEAGTRISIDRLARRAVPAQHAPQTALRAEALDQIEGAIAREALRAGDPILPGMLMRSEAPSALADALAPGMRALTVPLDAPLALPQALRQGDRIDLLITSETGNVVARFDGLALLAALVPGASAAMVGVERRQAEKLLGALRQGRAALLLRHPTDRDPAGAERQSPARPPARAVTIVYGSGQPAEAGASHPAPAGIDTATGTRP